MRAQVVSLRKRFAANTARVRFDTGVNSLVQRQVLLLDKLFVAKAAREPLHAVAAHLVTAQIAVRDELLAAVLARAVFHLQVAQLVRAAAAGPVEAGAAYRAQQRHFLLVPVHVTGQMGLLYKSFLAQRALVAAVLTSQFHAREIDIRYQRG